jgi:indole-3-glycerol phosphate synthase
MILDDIMAYKREELAQRRKDGPLSELESLGRDRTQPVDFAAALRGTKVCLIAEVKRASPSKGVFRLDLNPVQLAETYVCNGAAAISVLTDRRYFQGELEYLSRIKSHVSTVRPSVPVLRKDFIFDPYQVHESFAYGADAVLLISAVLSEAALAELRHLTHELGMTALVEVHDDDEVERALTVDPLVIGVNNRNLHDFSVNLATFERLQARIPPETVTIAESGIRSAMDVRRVAAMGADAILVGEALVTARDVPEKVQELANVVRAQSPQAPEREAGR